MSFDTQAIRLSVLGYGLPCRIALPLPDGDIDQSDRQHLLGLCILPLVISPSGGGGAFSLPFRKLDPNAKIRRKRVDKAPVKAEDVAEDVRPTRRRREEELLLIGGL